MSAYTDAVLATTPLRYWPLDETSGATARELVATETASCQGALTMGGADAPPGIGGKCLNMAGHAVDYLLLRANKLLGGNAAWTVGAWVLYGASDTNDRVFYGEYGGTGNDRVFCGVNGATSAGLKTWYGDDSANAAVTSPVVFIQGGWAFVVMTRSGATVEQWWNVGRRNLNTGLPAGSTWTQTGVDTRVGTNKASTDAAAWIGRVAHLAVWNRVLSKADQLAIYNAGSPLSRTLVNRKFFRANSIWNQKLTTPGNAPTVDPNSAASVQKLVNQVSQYGGGSTNTSTGPFFVAHNTDPLQRVRMTASGSAWDISDNAPDLHNALGLVRMPAAFNVVVNSDREASIYNADTDELWEFIEMEKTLTKPLFSWSLSAGSGPPAANYSYYVVGALANGTLGEANFSLSGGVALNGSQRITISWSPVQSADHMDVFRQNNAVPGSLTLVYSGTGTSFTDTGIVGPVGSDAWAFPANAVTSDWGSGYAGYISATNSNVGHYESPHANWGPGAAGMPLWGGSISLVEAQAGLIDHALAMSLPEVDINFHLYPAQRNDGTFWPANALPEGLRFQLDPSFDISTLPYAFDRAVAKACQDYGAYVRDTTGGGGKPAFYMESQQFTGRDFYPLIFEGRWDYELFAGFPWSSMRVIAPSWTQAQTTGVAPPASNGPISAFSDNFDDNSINATKWPTTPNVTETGGQLRIATRTDYGGAAYNNGSYVLTASSLACKIAQAPTGDVGDECFIRLQSGTLGGAYIEFAVSGGELVADYTTSSGQRLRAGTAVIYDPATHVWVRMSESSGTVTWETSPDASSWTTFATLPWQSATGRPLADLESVTLLLTAGNWNGATGRPDFVVDNVNTSVASPPPPPPPPPPVGTFVLRRSDVFPDGTVVKAYLASGVHWGQSGAPAGAVIESQTMASGSATFAQLAAGVPYVFYALVGGQDRAVFSRISTTQQVRWQLAPV